MKAESNCGSNTRDSSELSGSDTKANYLWLSHQDTDQLCKNLADSILQNLQLAIDEKGQGVLALSGGSTPVPLFKELAQRDFDWSRLVLTLVDERWVPTGHPMSNASLLMAHFLDKVQNCPRFVPLFMISSAAMSVEPSIISVMTEYCYQTQSTRGQLAPLDVVVLGMGGDGHTASFFPDAENIDDLIDPNSTEPLLSCHSPSSQLPRITWSVPVICKAKYLALHITGKDKKTVFESALAGQCAKQLPVRSMIFQNKTPLKVFYCD